MIAHLIHATDKPNVHMLQHEWELEQCFALRRQYERDFVGRVDVPVNVLWLVATVHHVVVACAGVAVVPGERKVIVTDLYHNGTRAGLRGMGALIHDVLASDMRIYATIPLDRPTLVRALERRGLRVTGYSMERKTDE